MSVGRRCLTLELRFKGAVVMLMLLSAECGRSEDLSTKLMKSVAKSLPAVSYRTQRYLCCSYCRLPVCMSYS